MDPTSMCPRPVLERDVRALIGLLAILEGQVMASRFESHAKPHVDAEFLDRLARRFASMGLTTDGASEHELRQALNDLNQRLRCVLGEHDDPSQSMSAL